MGRYRYSRDEDDKPKGHKFKWFGNNRLLCDVLEDMRKVVSADQGSSILRGLIEEAQVMGNRMESALSDQKDLLALNQAASDAKKAYRKLEREYRELESKVEARRPKNSKLNKS